MWKCIRPSRYFCMQTTLCQKSAGIKIGLPFSNTVAPMNMIPRGTLGYSQDNFSRNDRKSTRQNTVNTSYPVTHREMSHWSSAKQNSMVNPLLSCSLNVRYYAKGKDRGSKSGKGKSKIDISPEEMRKVVDNERLLSEFDELIENFKEALTSAVALRTNIGSIEELPIELEGDTYPLNELAQVHRKSPTLVIVNCSAFPQATKSVVTAIANSGMNLNPQQEGYSIAVPIPMVTREHREGLASKAKLLCNKCKDNLRTVHNNHVRKAKTKEGQVSEDTLYKTTLKIKEMLDERVKEAESLLAIKQAELLKSS